MRKRLVTCFFTRSFARALSPLSVWLDQILHFTLQSWLQQWLVEVGLDKQTLVNVTCPIIVTLYLI